MPKPQTVRVPISVRRICPTASFVGCADLRIVDVQEQSQACVMNSLFAAISGTQVDGKRYIEEAMTHGATSLLVETPIPSVSIPQCIVPDVRNAYAQICEALAGSPSRRLKVVGVTGTNGKTTITWLTRSIFQAAGHQTGLVGTIEYHDGQNAAPSDLTTPDSQSLSHLLANMVANRTTHAAIEFSSHALHQSRVSGVQLDVAVVTPITHDHLDYHADPECYRESKARILQQCKSFSTAIINVDNPGSATLCDRVDDDISLIRYGTSAAADTRVTILEESLTGSRFELQIQGETIEINTPLVGRHNIDNCVAAVTACRSQNVSWDEIVRGIAALDHVPGRLERVETGQSFHVFVDYAHTDDALRRCIQSLKRHTTGRVICVFGAGGDRDSSKRPKLGQAASTADLAVITSDNPRSEDPHQIVGEIEFGLKPAGTKYHIEVDRQTAIRWAIAQADSKDTVLIAGKGHETVQIVGDEAIPFDDRHVARECLAGSMAHSASPRQKHRTRTPMTLPQSTNQPTEFI